MIKVTKKKTTTKPTKSTGKISKLFKKMNGTSNLEYNFAKLLDKLKISYIQHFTFKKREFDFLLVDYNVLVETHGCFFHCCKQDKIEAKYPFQKKNIKNDTYKAKLVKFDPTYKLLVIWEHEMNSSSQLKEKITKFLNNIITD
jgi:G:T-mismatch repair DNA endonuclease (very short patch repair protein)